MRLINKTFITKGKSYYLSFEFFFLNHIGLFTDTILIFNKELFMLHLLKKKNHCNTIQFTSIKSVAFKFADGHKINLIRILISKARFRNFFFPSSDQKEKFACY